MRDRYDDQHASEFGDCWNSHGGMASEHQWHLQVGHASWNPVIAGRGNGHMGKDHINDLNHQDCTISRKPAVKHGEVDHCEQSENRGSGGRSSPNGHF